MSFTRRITLQYFFLPLLTKCQLVCAEKTHLPFLNCQNAHFFFFYYHFPSCSYYTSVYLSIILIPMCAIKRVLTYPYFASILLYSLYTIQSLPFFTLHKLLDLFCYESFCSFSLLDH